MNEIESIFLLFSFLTFNLNIMSFTYKPKKRKRAKTHGFLVRSKSKYGRNTIKRRRQIGRKKITV